MTTSTTRTIASPMVVVDRVDGLLNELGRVIDDRVLEARREVLRKLFHRRLDRSAVASAFEPGSWKMPSADRRIAIEVGIDRVVERGKLDAAHVLQAHDRVVGLLDDDVGELVRVAQAARAFAPLSGRRPGWATGGWLSTPEATWTFWPCSAATTSPAVSASDCRRSGSSQTRIE